ATACFFSGVLGDRALLDGEVMTPPRPAQRGTQTARGSRLRIRRRWRQGLRDDLSAEADALIADERAGPRAASDEPRDHVLPLPAEGAAQLRHGHLQRKDMSGALHRAASRAVANACLSAPKNERD